jgi:putative ABC transport system substrate-binding protein
MSRLGWIEGRDFEIVAKFAAFTYDRFPLLVEELLKEKVDIVLTAGPTTRVAPIAAKAVPVVFGFSGDPVAAGVVKSLANPGMNATGMSAMALELAGKRLSLLLEAAPTIRRVGILSNPNHAGEQSEWAATETTAKSLAVELKYYKIPNAAEIPLSLEAAARDGCDGLLTFPEAVSLYNRRTITVFALQRQLPTMFGWKVYCTDGGLLSYGPDLEVFYGRLATYVDRILRGANANDLPVELPTVLETAVNAGTARAIGLTIPVNVLARADDVIE